VSEISTPQARHPYERLTPDVVLDALASVGLHGDGRLMALSSYENRVYQVHLEDGRAVVAKFYRPERWSEAQIAEEHAFAHELVQAEVPVVAPLVLDGRTLHHHDGFAFAVSPRQGGRRPELDDPEVLERIGRFLARIHNVGASKHFEHRPALTVQTFGHDSIDWLLKHEAIPLDAQTAWEKVARAAVQAAQQAFDALALDSMDAPHPLRLHGDCHPGNILWTQDSASGPGGPHFVDLDDARTGFAVQDLWMLLGPREEQGKALYALLDGYEQMRPFNHRELSLIEPLRTLRLIHYSAWLAQRWSDPAFRQHFPWFGSSGWWQQQTQVLREQIEAMTDGAGEAMC
jgi:Ser/Thr protein kinase RdoA (MazF antagonist)